jgi:fucose permease
MIAAPFAGWLALQFGDWKLLFLVFGIVSLLSVIWLYFTDIDETKNTEKRATFASSFKLLSTGYISMMVLGIFLVVGIDVGVNAFSGQFLLAKFNSPQTFAESGRSVYFFGKMLGTFSGAILLARLSTRRFFLWSAILGLISILAFIFAPGDTIAIGLIFVIGLGVANIFPIMYSLTVEKYSLRANEISGLMIMAICGGAVLPLLMGWISDMTGNITSAMMVLVAAISYLLFVSLLSAKSKK